MMRTLMKMCFLALLLTLVRSGYAVDGQVLINQSNIVAMGGFPYHITQPGSYKLSGNLTVPLNLSAIEFDTSNATLDLNGFTVSCSFDERASFLSACITDGQVARTALDVKNGAVLISATAPTFSFGSYVVAVSLGTSSGSTVEDLRLSGKSTNYNVGGLLAGQYFLLKNNVFSGDASPSISCPSVLVANVNGTLSSGSSGSGCVGNSNYNFVSGP